MGSDGVLIGVGSVEIGVLIGVYGDRVLIAWVSFRWVLIEWVPMFCGDRVLNGVGFVPMGF